MNFTFRNNIWKGDATNSVVPTNARPFTNDDSNLKTMARVPGRANPIKHWRKQLHPRYPTKSSKQVSIDMIDAPSSVVYLTSKNYDYDCSLNNSKLLKENILILSDCNKNSTSGIKVTDSTTNTSIRCIGGKHNVRRSASTNINKNYYRNYSKYMQSKCRTYDQNTTLGSQNSDGTYQGAKCFSKEKSFSGNLLLEGSFSTGESFSITFTKSVYTITSIIDEINQAFYNLGIVDFNVSHSTTTNKFTFEMTDGSTITIDGANTSSFFGFSSDGTHSGTTISSDNTTIDVTTCNKPIVYKPSNSAFMKQGSVSSSTNILRKRNMAMTNNSASLKNAYGLTYVHKLTYASEIDGTPYNIRYTKGNNTPDLCNQQFKVCNTSS